MQRLTETEVQEIVELRRNGETLKSIASKYNVTGERIRQIIKRYNVDAQDPVTVRIGKRVRSEAVMERRKKVAELRNSGMTLHKIAETMGIHKYIVIQDCRIMRENGEIPEKTTNN